MKSRIITAVTVRNGEEFIQQTLAAIARQTLRPDRVIIFDNQSTDRTLEIVRQFTALPCEISIAETSGQCMFANFNRAAVPTGPRAEGADGSGAAAAPH